MPLPWDPDVLSALQPILAANEGVDPPPPGDVVTRRAAIDALFAVITAQSPSYDDVKVIYEQTVSLDGTDVPIRVYRPDGATEGPLVVYFHGGGMIMGNLDQYDAIIKGIAHNVAATVVAPEYRLAPEHPDPAPVEDCYAALVWAAAHAAELGADPDRIGIAGDSAGGGLGAGVALLARDRRGPAVARQLLIYPMLDDRTVIPDPQIVDSLVWTYDDNITGWDALLGESSGAADGVSIYAAPARAVDLSGLPPAYIDVGGLDLFRDEDAAYATRLAQAGVPAELHVYSGVPHAFEALAPQTDVAKRTVAGRFDFLRGL